MKALHAREIQKNRVRQGITRRSGRRCVQEGFLLSSTVAAVHGTLAEKLRARPWPNLAGDIRLPSLPWFTILGAQHEKTTPGGERGSDKHFSAGETDACV